MVEKLVLISLLTKFDGDGNLIKNAAAGKMDYGFTKNVADVAALDAMATCQKKLLISIYSYDVDHAVSKTIVK